MVELIGAGLVGAASMFGFLKSKEMAESRIGSSERRFRSSVVGLTVGLSATILTAGVAAFVPLIGTGAAVVFGTGIGTGAGSVH